MKKMISFLLAVLLVIPAAVFAENGASSIAVGDIVTLGHYEIDGNVSNGADPIDWIVVDVDEAGGKALVVSYYSLDRLLYHKSYEPVTWETSDLRKDLNSEFLTTAFTQEEIKQIVPAKVHTMDNAGKGTKGGEDTIDQIFILSAEEAERYFPTEDARRGIPSAYLVQLCSCTFGLEYTTTVWWLRTPGENQAHAAYIFGGQVNAGGWAGNVHKLPIRPAMWIAIS